MHFKAVHTITPHYDAGDVIHADQLPEWERLLKIGAIVPHDAAAEAAAADASKPATDEECQQMAEAMGKMQEEIDSLREALARANERLAEQGKPVVRVRGKKGKSDSEPESEPKIDLKIELDEEKLAQKLNEIVADGEKKIAEIVKAKASAA